MKDLFNILNDFTDKEYPDLDLAELFAEHQERVQLAKEEELKAREEAKAAAAAAKATEEDATGVDATGTDAAVETEKKADEEEKADEVEEVKEPAVKRAKVEGGGDAPPQDAMRGLEEEIAACKKKGNRTYYVFDMQVPGAIFIKLADWARPHIDVKRIGVAIVKHVKET